MLIKESDPMVCVTGAGAGTWISPQNGTCRGKVELILAAHIPIARVYALLDSFFIGSTCATAQ